MQLRNGNADMGVADDAECIARVREFLAYMPTNCEADEPPRARTTTRPTASARSCAT